jgi:F-type H+-transporting ATPase subunit epsilon
MDGLLSLSIVTPEKRLVSDQVNEVRAPGAEGSFGVLPGHTPFLTLMSPGGLVLTKGNVTETYAVGGGFVEVSNDSVNVLTESAIKSTEIDVAAARAELAEVQGKLKNLPTHDPAYKGLTARLTWAQARIAVAENKA